MYQNTFALQQSSQSKQIPGNQGKSDEKAQKFSEAKQAKNRQQPENK